MAISEIYTGVLTRSAGTLTATDRWTSAGGVFHDDYPVNGSGVAQDAGVLAEIEDVLAALADADGFADGFKSGGLFAAVNTDAEGDMLVDPFPSPSAIFERPRGKLSIVSAATDFTRLGAWSHQVSANAVSALSAQSYTRDDRGRELGAFAYSPLDPTAAYTSATSRLYPARGAGNVAATYAGETVAAQADLFYKGAVEATVFWDPTTVTASKIRVTISDLAETETGDTLQIGRYVTDSEGNVGPGIAEVDSLTWTANIETDEGVVKFSSSDSVRVVRNDLGNLAFKPSYDDQLRFEFTPSPSGHIFHFGEAFNHNSLQTPQSNQYGVLRVTAVRQSGSLRSPNAADQAQFALNQAMLRMPKWVIAGPTTNTSTSSSNSSPTWVFVFADGSMLQYGNQHGSTAILNNPTLVNNWRRAFGIDPNKNPASLYATDISGDPALSDNNGEYLFTRPGSGDARGYPTAGGTNIGVGRPSMSPSELYAAYLAEGGYINIEVSDSTAALASELEGMFVGQDADGPLGIIGNWSLTGDAFGSGETRGPIRGAFGADFQP